MTRLQHGTYAISTYNGSKTVMSKT